MGTQKAAPHSSNVMHRKIKLNYKIPLSVMRILSILYIVFIVLISLFFIGVMIEPDQEGWIAIGFLYIFSPAATAIGLLVIAIPSYLLSKKYKMREFFLPMNFGIFGSMIMWIETGLIYFQPLGLIK